MTVSGIISVSGIPGLHKILSQTKNGLIVESLIDGKRRPIYSTQKVSALEDISIYTQDEDMPLVEVFEKIFDKEGGKKSLDHKTKSQELRDYLSGLIESVDQERVYNSDIAKLFQWYNLLVDKGLLNKEEEKEEGEKEEKAKAPKAAAKKKTAPAVKPKRAPIKSATASAPQKKGRQKK